MAASNKAVGTWNTAADWTPSGVPSDIVTITTTGTNTLYTLSGAASNTITGLNISAPSLKFATLVFATNATLNVSGNVAFAQTGTSAALAASLRGQGTLNVTGSISGSGTLASTSAVTLKIVANSLNSTGLVASASATSAVVDLNLTNTSTLASISVSNTAMVRLSSGSLTVASVVGGNLNTGTIAAFGGALTITNVLTTGTAAAQTLLASGGTITVNGGSMGGGGLTFADVAGSRFNVGGALTSGSINFAGTGNNSQTLNDTLGTALTGRTIVGFKGSNTITVAGAVSYKVISGGTGGSIGAINGANGTIEVLTFGAGTTIAATNTVINSATLLASAACYLAGTQILTVAGKVAVEDLAIGDMLVTENAGPQSVRWIGQRAYLARLVNTHHRAGLMPVRVSAGALADNVPARDLFVSPEHMLALDGMLVAAHNLVNGSTITRVEDIDVVKYFHIELDQHSVIFAEGAASESYLDTGNRNMFTNVLDYAEIGMPVGSTVPCLPIASDGPVLAAIRAGIADRAEACGFTTSADADLHLLVDGAVIYPSAVVGGSYSFDIAEHTGEMRIVSRSVVPAEIEPVSTDRRRLGVAVAKLTLRGNGMLVDVMAGEKLLAEGFFPADGGHRWTNGSAQFPAALLALMDGAFSVTVELVGTGLRYPVASRGDVVALAAARGPRVASAQRLVA